MSKNKQSSMDKEFVPYEEALALKELGFDEPCFGYFIAGQLFVTTDTVYNSLDIPVCKAPTFSQAFRWFIDIYGLCIVIKPIDDKNLGLGYSLIKNGLIMKACTTYEEAELACLRMLIEIAKEPTNEQQ